MSFRPVLSVDVAAFCHQGRVRANNEDLIALDAWVQAEPMFVPVTAQFNLDRPLLFAVADGMGGHEAGEVASALAIRLVVQQRARLRGNDAVADVINEAHQAILAHATAEPSTAGMGTTIVGLQLRPDGLTWFNVGDSRLYRLRDGYLRQLSVDDVPAFEREQALSENRPARVLSACLGGRQPAERLQPHGATEALPEEGCWLLCSDGLSDVLDVETIEADLKSGVADDLLRTVLRLFDKAMRSGGPDNISIVLVRVSRLRMEKRS